MRLNSFSLQKKVSIRWRHLYISRSMSRDEGLGAACIEVGQDGVAIEGGVGDQRPKGEPVNERRHAYGVEALPWQKHEAHEIAQGVREHQDFGGQAAFRATDGLARSPPFA